MSKLIFKGNDADLAHSYHCLGLAYYHQNNYKLALDNYEKALKMRKELYPNRDHPDTAGTLNNIGI